MQFINLRFYSCLFYWLIYDIADDETCRMLTKVLIALIPLLAISSGQIPDWTNTQELDPNGTFRLFWTVQPEAGDIVLQVQAKALGWVSIALINEEGNFADLIVGGYDNEIGLPYVYVNHLTL